MNNNLMSLIQTIKKDEGKKINTLIKHNIISLEQATSEVIKLNINKAAYIYYFAKYVKDAPIDKLADALIKIGNGYFMTYDPLESEKVWVSNAHFIYYFARDIEDAPVEKLIEALIKTKNKTYIQLFLNDVKKLLIANKTETEIHYLGYIYSLVDNKENAILDKLKSIIIKNGGKRKWLKEIKKIEEEINEAYLNNLVSTGNEEALKEKRDEFAKLFEDNDSKNTLNKNLMNLIQTIKDDEGKKINTLIKCNIISLEQATSEVIKLNINKAVYIYYFAKYVKDAPIDKLADALIEIGNGYFMAYDLLESEKKWVSNAYFIYLFARDIEGAPVEKLIEAIIKTNYIQLYIDYYKEMVILAFDDAEHFWNIPSYYSFHKKIENYALDRLDKLKSIIIKSDGKRKWLNKWLKEIKRAEEEIEEQKNAILMKKMLKLVETGNEKVLKSERDDFTKIFEDNDSEKPKTRTRRPN